MRHIKEPRPIVTPQPRTDLRQLCQRMSRSAAMLDRYIIGNPIDPARHIDYVQRRSWQRDELRGELEQLKAMLSNTTI